LFADKLASDCVNVVCSLGAFVHDNMSTCGFSVDDYVTLGEELVM